MAKVEPGSREPEEASGRAPVPSVNEVRLVGRVGKEPQRRELPSGDELWSFRVVVDRTAGGRSTVDAVECGAWSARTRRSVRAWRPGDFVEVVGSLRRRFYRGGAGAVSVVEVEVRQARIIRRVGNA